MIFTSRPVSVYNIVPCPKPRMTQRDKWKPSAAAKRFFAFRDECAVRNVAVPESGAWIIFHIPMPPSWSKKKKNALGGTPHQQRPDKDNLEKALLDAVYGGSDDCRVWDSRVTKLWGWYGAIEIRRGAIPREVRS